MKKIFSMMIGGIAACLLLGGTVFCQTAPVPAPATEAARVAGVPATVNVEHPLMPVIRWAEQARPKIAAIQDYTATLRKQENINGRLHGVQVMEIKVRHEPFSVYTRFLFPNNMQGQQAIYVEGQNDNRLVAHGVGIQRLAGTMMLPPDGFLPMQGQKYPITMMGILNLVDQLVEAAHHTIRIGGECVVTYHEGVVLGTGESARECTMIQIVLPERRRDHIFHIARIFVDNELNLPIRYESHDWPNRPGEPPVLHEVYQYMDLKLNVGLTDADFDHKNPKYNFP